MIEKIYEKGTIGWLKEQAGKDGFDNLLDWNEWKQNKNIDKKNKTIKRWEESGILNIFKNKGFNNEDRENWYNFLSKVDIKDNINECWNWTEGKTGSGYGQFNISRTPIYAHHLVHIFTKGNIPDRLQVLHICNNPGCCNPNHLEIGDQSKNMRYMFECNRHTGTAQLAECQITEIRELYNKLQNQYPNLKRLHIAKLIAPKFGISNGYAAEIIAGRQRKI